MAASRARKAASTLDSGPQRERRPVRRHRQAGGGVEGRAGRADQSAPEVQRGQRGARPLGNAAAPRQAGAGLRDLPVLGFSRPAHPTSRSPGRRRGRRSIAPREPPPWGSLPARIRRGSGRTTAPRARRPGPGRSDGRWLVLAWASQAAHLGRRTPAVRPGRRRPSRRRGQHVAERAGRPGGPVRHRWRASAPAVSAPGGPPRRSGPRQGAAAAVASWARRSAGDDVACSGDADARPAGRLPVADIGPFR